MVDSFLSEVVIYFRPDGERGEIPESILLGRNDFPLLNPQLSKQLRVGESTNWMTRLSTIRGVIAAGASTGINFCTVRAQVRLATGETIESQEIAVDSLPRD